MKSKTQVLKAFLIIATVETISLFIQAGAARTETLLSEQNFGSYVASLPIELSQEKSSETEQRFRNFIVASLDPSLEPQTSATEQNFGSYIAALPIESTQAQSKETEQLVAFLAQPSQAQPFVGEQDYIKDIPPANTDLAQPTKQELSAAEQSYSNYLVALRQQSESQSQPQVDTGNAHLTNPASPISTELKILSPAPSTVLDIPAATVTVQYPLGSEVELRANGVLINSSLIGATETNTTTKVVTQTWYGVPLKEGENTIAAQTKTNGSAGQLASVKVQVRGVGQQLKVETVEAKIPADGRSTATIQGQLLDKNGNRSNRSAVVTLETSAGEFVGADADKDREGFQVKAQQGQFTAKLRSGVNAQTVQIRASSGKLEAFTQVQFETNLRSSIVTGVIDLRIGGRGTNFYKSFRDFLPPDKDNSTGLDFHTSVFATGKVGEWLFTGAYNSDRTLNKECDGTTRLYRDYQQPCNDRNYPVYGDNSKIETLTPSQDSLYLRFERSARIPGAEPDYGMWGDYNTKEFARASQQFTATSRNLHGFKANYNIGNLQVTGFYGNNVDGFQRDAIAPDGTSGYYFLSQRLLIPGSENVFIELEELNRPGTVLQHKQLLRGTDYEIDYDRGTLLFRQPILRTDINEYGQVLVRRIVTTYQFESRDNKNNNIYGGRVQYNISRGVNHESWVAATYIKENEGVRDFELYGADALYSLSSKAHLIAEYAHSNNDSELNGTKKSRNTCGLSRLQLLS